MVYGCRSVLNHGFDKEGVDRNRIGRIMRWDAATAQKSRQRVVQFLENNLRAVSPAR
jgi:dienelactone hydrolase